MTVRELIKKLKEECKGEKMDAEVMVQCRQCSTLDPIVDISHEGPCIISLEFEH